MKRAWHIGITVSDIEKSINFYRDILGLKLLDGPTLPAQPIMLSRWKT